MPLFSRSKQSFLGDHDLIQRKWRKFEWIPTLILNYFSNPFKKSIKISMLKYLKDVEALIGSRTKFRTKCVRLDRLPLEWFTLDGLTLPHWLDWKITLPIYARKSIENEEKKNEQLTIDGKKFDLNDIKSCSS